MNAMVASQSLPKIRILNIIKSLPDVFVIAFVIFSWWAVTEYQHSQRMLLVEQPLVNDFFLVDYHRIDSTSDPQFRFLPLKIVDITEHELHFVRGNYGHSKATSFNEQVKFDAVMNYNYFQQDVQVISRQRFQSWAEQNIIYDASRPEGIYIKGWIVLRPAEAMRGYKRNRLFLAQSQSID